MEDKYKGLLEEYGLKTNEN